MTQTIRSVSAKRKVPRVVHCHTQWRRQDLVRGGTGRGAEGVGTWEGGVPLPVSYTHLTLPTIFRV